MNNFVPKESYKRISDISLDFLITDKNIKGLIFDFDGTIRRNRKISKDTILFIKKAKDRGLQVSILSNNIYIDVSELEHLNIAITKKLAFKPLKKPFLNIANDMNLKPENIAVIGNNRISDIWGANRAKMYSIYIQNFDNYKFKLSRKKEIRSKGIKPVK